MPLKRKLYKGTNYRRALTIDELELIARRYLPNFSWEFMRGGAETERSLNWNRTALDRLRLVPATLVDTSQRSLRTKLFGAEMSAPVIIAPTGLNGIYRNRGDLALAKAAEQSQIPFTLSTVSNMRLEDIADQSSGHLWMQLYVLQDRAIARDIIDRAQEAGYEALVFTTDANVFGHREWDKRNYRAPAKLKLRNTLDVACHPRWIADVLLSGGIPEFVNIARFLPPEARSARAGVAIVPRLFAADISWDDVKWIRDRWHGKLLLKGILNVEDAQHAARLGCDGIVLSNHGGRQLDGCISPIEALPEISSQLGDRLTVIVDGGFRRGSDVVKAIALGADAVMLGRAPLYGLAAGGEAGVCHALEILTTEIDRTLGQLGCRSIEEVGSRLIANPGELQTH